MLGVEATSVFSTYFFFLLFKLSFEYRDNLTIARDTGISCIHMYKTRMHHRFVSSMMKSFRGPTRRLLPVDVFVPN